MSVRKQRKEHKTTVQEPSVKSPLYNDAYSDTEAGYGSSFKNTAGYYPVSSSLPSNLNYNKDAENRLYTMLDNNLTEGEDNYHDPRSLSNDEFGENQNYSNRIVRTGRQRKKLAARSKGGEFQTKRSKKRVYFCCVGSEIDVQKLFDYLVSAGGLLFGWQYNLYNDVLHLYKAGHEETLLPVALSKQQHQAVDEAVVKLDDFSELSMTPIMYKIEQHQLMGRPKAQSMDSGGFESILRANKSKQQEEDEYSSNHHQLKDDGEDTDRGTSGGRKMAAEGNNPFRISGIGAQEVFVFDFGATVFWGFSRGEEVNLLKTIRMFVTKGSVGAPEFQSGVDDMAFVTSPDAVSISLANDVITLPDDSVAKQRLSVSFAIAQSSVLAIFEARIEKKVEEYKYIPETLAAHGKVHLSERQLGMMIGEVFVIRHDVNLHTEILDTPDFFWKEEKFEVDYRMVMSYLEMSGRTEILNKRLDMLRELLDVLQQQMENAHAVKLEMIVIYLIVMEVVLQVFAIISK